jgi:hypothetical protein
MAFGSLVGAWQVIRRLWDVWPLVMPAVVSAALVQPGGRKLAATRVTVN